ncbi:MAG TPA: helix-turn-helix domain-containing protein [Chloroflexota bacterium]|nr:helix-turn-helix domain-containing protein [Chloroflexota bacterium]
MSDVGEILRGTRERKGLSLEEASAATRIKQKYLDALEQGEYHLLPGKAYTLGFLRNYATYLGLHPDDVAEEYHSLRPPEAPEVRPVSKIMATGDERMYRQRVLWVLGALILVLAGAYAVKQYNEATAHAYVPPVNVTPANLGGLSTNATNKHVTKQFTVRLAPTGPVWIRVSVDGRRAFQGKLNGPRAFTALHNMYLITRDGKHLLAHMKHRIIGPLGRHAGLEVGEFTASGWRRVA